MADEQGDRTEAGVVLRSCSECEHYMVLLGTMKDLGCIHPAVVADAQECERHRFFGGAACYVSVSRGRECKYYLSSVDEDDDARVAALHEANDRVSFLRHALVEAQKEVKTLRERAEKAERALAQERERVACMKAGYPHSIPCAKGFSGEYVPDPEWRRRYDALRETDKAIVQQVAEGDHDG